MKTNYLECKFDSRDSFYHKAVVKEIGKKKILYSFKTRVCVIENGDYKLNTRVRKDLLFSSTTLRHIKEFLKQELGIEVNKKQLKERI